MSIYISTPLSLLPKRLADKPSTFSPGGPNTSEKPGVSDERGQHTTDNIRYGQNISESGVGGMTTTSTGDAEQSGGYGGKPNESEQLKNSRREQGYGPGSGVGA